MAQSRDRLIELAENIYARISSPNGNAVGNSGFLLLNDSVLVFDTHFTPEAGRELLNDIRSVTDKPVHYVVNSHYHPDHTHGNQIFDQAHIISSLGTRHGILDQDLPSLNRTIQVVNTQLERMQKQADKEKDPEKLDSIREQIQTRREYLENLSRIRITAPIVVLDEYLAVRSGSFEVRIQNFGPGHCGSDTILYVPSQKIVFCGGLFFNDAVPNVQDAEILKWMDSLKRILELDADLFVPGHGPPGDRRDVRNFLEYFEDLRMLVEPYVAGGKSVDQAMLEVMLPEKYLSYRFKNLFPANIERMYEELKLELLQSIPIEGPQLPKS